MAKKVRDFDNPVFVHMETKEGKSLEVAVATFDVRDKWLVLERVDEKTRVTKFVSLDTLARFSFDAPITLPSMTRRSVLDEDAPSGPVSMAPGRDALVAAIQEGAKAGKRRVVNPKAVPEIPEVSESDMIQKSMAGVGIARMG